MITPLLYKVPDPWVTSGSGPVGSVAIMQIKRIVQHGLMTQGQVNRAFPLHALKIIDAMIKASESTGH